MSIRICGDNTVASPAITSASDTDTGLQFGTNEVKVVNGNLDITDGNLIVASGHGIDFSNNTGTPTAGINATVDANTLQDYEEGYFDIDLYGSTSGTFSLKSDSTKLKYIKIGRKVTIFGRFNVARGTAVGGVRMTLPFAPDTSFGNGPPDFNGLSVFTHDIQDTGATNTIGSFGEISPTHVYVTLFWLRTGQAWHSMDATDISTSLNVSWVYIAGSFYSAV